MSDEGCILKEMAARLYTSASTPGNRGMLDAGTWPGDAWREFDELGLTLALLREEDGGPGFAIGDAAALIGLCGRHALPLPLAETMLARRFLAAGGLVADDGPLTFVPGNGDAGPSAIHTKTGWRLEGTAKRVPWAGQAVAIAVVCDAPGGPIVARVPRDKLSIDKGFNLANEPRDDVTFDVGIDSDDVGFLPARWDGPLLWRCGAALRALAMAGALEAILELTIEYAREREQFGRPIAGFQAVQQNLACMAGHVAAAKAAVEHATESFFVPGSDLPVAVSKARIGEAAAVAVPIAHQVHGAIGFTREHALNFFTRRLWAWRSEFGGETEWNRRVGRAAFAAGAPGLWPMISAL